jgi:nucleoside-diphosphate-sugar epimerase
LGEKSSGKLELVEADLLKEGSFDDAVKGCTYVFHTASPFQLNVADATRDLIEPAVNGTRNVLLSAAKNKDTIKRVIVTSSIAAIRGMGSKPQHGDLFNEEDWNTVSTIEKAPYPLSKRLAEEEAWKIAKEHNLDLVTINPAFVVGPAQSSRTDGTSIKWMKGLLEGEVKGIRFTLTDVRDVALAHIRAAERPEATGRHLVSSKAAVNPSTSASIVAKAFPAYNINVESFKQFDLPTVDEIDSSKVKRELGVELTPIEQSLVDMAASLIKLGIVPSKL